MKIEDINKSKVEIFRTPSPEERHGNMDAGLEFRRQLNTVYNANYEKHIKDLTDSIYAQGAVVAKRADIKELQKYRELITQLVNETVSNSYAFSKLSKTDLNGRHKVFALIRRINQKLDDMASEVLKDQADNIALMQMADDIRGILVDMFL